MTQTSQTETATPPAAPPVDSNRQRPLGLPDDAFEQRRPARGQITKSEVRAVSLYALGLHPHSIVWDIGAGSGSISVEAAQIAHRGSIYAIDKDANSAALLQSNVSRFGSGRVSIVIGAAPHALRDLPDPDSVFIGGGGPDLPAIIQTVVNRLRHNGSLVANFAAMARANATYQSLKDARMSPQMTMITAARARELPDGVLRLKAMNPVFIVWGQK